MVLLPPTISRVLARASGCWKIFLLHVVPVGAEFDCGGGELRDVNRTVDQCAVEAGDGHFVGAEFGDIAVFQIDHVAGDLEQGRGIGSRVVAAVGNAEQQG